jgi:hypothetical protein
MSSVFISYNEKEAAEGLTMLYSVKHSFASKEYIILPKLYIVDSIVSHCYINRSVRFLTKWKGYTKTSWEPFESFVIDGKYNMILTSYCAENRIVMKKI